MRGWPVFFGLLVLPHVALAQGTDYSAGKTPAQLFAGDCSACHKTPRGLAKNRDTRALAGFLREHYTTKAASAGALAAYLVTNPTLPAAAEERSKRTPGAEDPTTIAVPEGGRPAAAARGKGKKPDPAEVAREAAIAAEEATKAKIHAYANAGENARPLPEATPATPAVSAIPAAPAAPDAAPEGASPAPSESPVTGAAPPAEPAPAAESRPPAEEHPATAPPG